MKQRQSNRFHSLQYKLTVSSTAVILVMVVLLELCVYTAVSRLQLRDAVQLNSELMQTMGNNFDNSVAAFKRQINFITMNKEMQSALHNKPLTAEQQLVYGNLLRSSVVENTLSLDEVDGVYLYGTDETLLTFWQKKYRAGDPHVLLPRMDKSHFPPNGGIATRFENGRLIYSRAIRDMQTLELLGYISLLYDSDALRKSIDTITPNPNRFIAVFDEKGQIIVHNSQSTELLQTVVAQTDLTAVSNNTFVRLDGIGTALVCRYTCRGYGWNMVCVVDQKQLMRSSDLTVLLILCFGVAGAALAAFVQALCAQRVVHPLRQMMQTVHCVEQGDYTAKATANTGDEIEVLAHSFNRMVDRIDVLVNQNLRGEIKYRDMQLMALQSQIDPHFLYNTLECINCLAQLGRKDEVRRVTIAFSNIMKSLAKGPQMVPIRDELAYTKDFLVIYKALLGDQLCYTLEAEPCLESVKIPRLMIQPLVENAVLHGIKPACRKGHVSVSVCSAQEGLLISIVDDGMGMPPEMEQALETYSARNCTAEETACLGVGVRNVIDRLWLVYGSTAQLHVQSSAAWGTTIDIMIPCRKEEGLCEGL